MKLESRWSVKGVDGADDLIVMDPRDGCIVPFRKVFAHMIPKRRPKRKYLFSKSLFQHINFVRNEMEAYKAEGNEMRHLRGKWQYKICLDGQIALIFVRLVDQNKSLKVRRALEKSFQQEYDMGRINFSIYFPLQSEIKK